MCTPNCIHTLQATTVKCTNFMYMHILFRGAMFDSWGWLFWVWVVFWFPNSKVINEWVSQTAIRFIHWLRILGCIDEIGQLAQVYLYEATWPFLLPTCDFTNHFYHLATKHWKLNSMTVQRSTSFPGQTPKIIYAWIHCAFQNLFTCSKGINIPPPFPSSPPHPPPQSKQHRLTNALHMTAQNDAKEET